jgi:hypothetical protein
MIDATKWKIRGPVATPTTEHSTWDIAREEWQPPRSFVITSFRPDGAVGDTDFHNPVPTSESPGRARRPRWGRRPSFLPMFSHGRLHSKPHASKEHAPALDH